MAEATVLPSHGVLSGNEGRKLLACHPTRGACDGEIPTETPACDAVVVQSANMGSKILCNSSKCGEIVFQHKGVGRLQPPFLSGHRAGSSSEYHLELAIQGKHHVHFRYSDGPCINARRTTLGDLL